jgi:hypothetical protein
MEEDIINKLNIAIKNYIKENNVIPDTIRISSWTYNKLNELRAVSYLPTFDLKYVLGLKIIIDKSINSDYSLIYKDKFVQTVFI